MLHTYLHTCLYTCLCACRHKCSSTGPSSTTFAYTDIRACVCVDGYAYDYARLHGMSTHSSGTRLHMSVHTHQTIIPDLTTVTELPPREKKRHQKRYSATCTVDMRVGNADIGSHVQIIMMMISINAKIIE